MTRPPEDPREQPPGTRQFGPNTDPAAIGDPVPPPPQYPQQDYTQQEYTQRGYTDPGPFGAPPPSQAYSNAGPPGPGEPLGYGSEPPAPKHTGRTVGLVLAVVAALVVIGIVAFLILRDGGGDATEAGASSTTQSSVVSSPSSAPSSETTTTTTTETTTTTSRSPSNQVTYQLTGGGSVITVSYEADGRPGFVASTGTPWSETARVSGGTAELTAIVISGTVTCTIMHDGQQISSATSSAGPLPLRCAASLQ